MQQHIPYVLWDYVKIVVLSFLVGAGFWSVVWMLFGPTN